jgi:hypothetical protein
MANTLGNLSLSDMKWLGEPLDAAKSFQQGANLVEQKQRIQQSAELQPLRVETARQGISLAKQKEAHLVEMNPLLQAKQRTSNLLDQQRFDKTEKEMPFDVKIKRLSSERAETEQYIFEANRDNAVKQYDSQTRILGEKAALYSMESEFARDNKDNRLAMSLLTLHQGQALLSKRNHDLNRATRRAQLDDVSKNEYEGDLNTLNEMAYGSNWEGIRTFATSPELTPVQKEAVLAERTRLMRRREYVEQESVNSHAALQAVNGRTSQTKANVALSELHRGIFTQPVKETQNWFLPDGSRSTAGSAALTRHNEYQKLLDTGLLKQDDVDGMMVPGASANPNTPGMPGLPGLGSLPAGQWVADREVFVPSPDMLRLVKKHVATKRAALTSDLTLDTAKTKIAGVEFEYKNTAGETVKLTSEKAAAKAKNVLEYYAELMDDEDKEYTHEAAMAKAMTANMMGSGEILGILNAADLDKQIKSGALKDGDTFLDLETGVMRSFNLPPSPSQGGGNKTKKGVDPYTGLSGEKLEAAASASGDDVFESRKEIYNALTGAGLDTALTQRILRRGIKSNFGILTDDYDADEPVSKLVRQVHEDAETKTEEAAGAISEILFGELIGSGKDNVRWGAHLATRRGSGISKYIIKKIEELEKVADKDASKWPKFKAAPGIIKPMPLEAIQRPLTNFPSPVNMLRWFHNPTSKAWSPEMVTKIRPLLVEFRDKLDFENQLKEARKKVK